MVNFMKALNNYKKTLSFLMAAFTFAAATVGCSSNSNSDSGDTSVVTSSGQEESSETDTSEKTSSSGSTAEIETLSSKNMSGSELFSDRDIDPSYNSVDAEITLNGDSIAVEGTGATSEGTTLTITEEGIYRITGTLSDGQIIVNAPKAKVQLVLDNASVSCSTSAPIYITDADKTFITLADGSSNTVTDGKTYVFSEDTEDEPDAAIFSHDSLTINALGSGSLTVNGNYSCGIRSKDDIVITGGDITVNAVDDGIKGKDYVAVADGSITVTAGGDGIKSTNSEDEGLGFIYIEDGSFNITASQDGMQAETVFNAIGGEFDITSGGGSSNSNKTHSDDFGGMGGGFGGRGGMNGNFEMPTDENGEVTMPDDFRHGGMGEGFEPPTDENGEFTMPDDFRHGSRDRSGFSNKTGTEESTSAEENVSYTFTDLAEKTVQSAESDDSSSDSTKGIKAGTSLSISGGDYNIDSADDALHSNGSVNIEGGTLAINAGDDGIHADADLTISGGAVDIKKSYEGLEAAVINIEGGSVELVSSDDGFNASNGSSQGAMGNYSSGVEISISGGKVYVNASGDGIDSNGDILISGGVVVVDGPTNSGNGAIDTNGNITVTGGVIAAAGMSGMAEAPGSSSTQYSVSAAFESTFEGGTLVTLIDESGEEIFSFAPSKSFNHIVISTPDIESGSTYKIYTGGSSSSEDWHALYENGGYKNDGTENASFTADSVVSYIGSQGMMGGGMGGRGGMNGGRGSFGGSTDENGAYGMPGGFGGEMPEMADGETLL